MTTIYYWYVFSYCYLRMNNLCVPSHCFHWLSIVTKSIYFPLFTKAMSWLCRLFQWCCWNQTDFWFISCLHLLRNHPVWTPHTSTRLNCSTYPPLSNDAGVVEQPVAYSQLSHHETLWNLSLEFSDAVCPWDQAQPGQTLLWHNLPRWKAWLFREYQSAFSFLASMWIILK